jgi:CubicO group peptidase (beta-lactamase class C family)
MRRSAQPWSVFQINGGSGAFVVSLDRLEPPATEPSDEFGIGLQVLRPRFGCGYNCAVIYDAHQAGLPEGKHTFFWDGAAGTWFCVNPTNDVVLVGMTQRLLGPTSPNLEYQSLAVVYQALLDPKI